MVPQPLDLVSIFDLYDDSMCSSDINNCDTNHSIEITFDPTSQCSSPRASIAELMEESDGSTTPESPASPITGPQDAHSFLDRKTLLQMLETELTNSENLRLQVAKMEHSIEVKQEEIESLQRSTKALERERETLENELSCYKESIREEEPNDVRVTNLEDELDALKESHKEEVQGLWKNIESIDNENVRLLKQLKKADEGKKCDIECDPKASDWKIKLEEDKKCKEQRPSAKVARMEQKLNTWMKKRSRKNERKSEPRRGSAAYRPSSKCDKSLPQLRKTQSLPLPKKQSKKNTNALPSFLETAKKQSRFSFVRTTSK